MPRRIRRFGPQRREIAPVERDVSGLSYAATDFHAHCVMCGMMAAMGRFQEAPHDVDTYQHFYGGSIRQQWELYPELRETALRLMLAQVDAIRAYLLGALGLSDEPDGEDETTESEFDESEEPDDGEEFDDEEDEEDD
jgi:hypothetical protein